MTDKKFSRSRAQRKSLLVSLMRALLIQERIVTTEKKAKYLRRLVDKLITWAKKDTLATRRLSFQVLSDHNLVKRLFDEIGPRYKNINGGYTRALFYKPCKGDNTNMFIVELTKRQEKKKTTVKKGKSEKDLDPSSQEQVQSKDETTTVVKPKEGLLSGVKKLFQKGKKN